MPLLSMPIILRGGRLAMMTRFLPISVFRFVELGDTAENGTALAAQIQIKLKQLFGFLYMLAV